VHGRKRAGVINLTTGMANALVDCCPVVAIGGSSPILQFRRQVFQEIDQVAIMRACVKSADRVYNLKRIPEQVNNAFQHAMSGKPGAHLSRFPRRHSVRQNPRGAGRLVDERPPRPERAPVG
jgi:thiamine pyrophosphate-dependent acetolactate synthase large subunit-like protein